MRESKRLLGCLGVQNDYSHPQRLLDDGENFVNVDLADTAPDHCSDRQHTLFILVEPFQMAADDQPDIFRNVDLIDLDVGAEPASRIKNFPLFEQMPVHLLDEDWISLGFLKDRAHQTLRSSLALAQLMPHLRGGVL